MPHKAAGAQYLLYSYTTPDSSANSITGEFEVVFRVALDNWDTADSGRLVEPIMTKWDSATGQSYTLFFGSGGASDLLLGIYQYNTSVDRIGAALSTFPLSSFTNGEPVWFRATIFDSGEADPIEGYHEFSTADQDTPPVSWTPESTNGGVSSGAWPTDDTTTPLVLCADSFGRVLNGELKYLKLYDGIGGTEVASFDITTGTGDSFPNTAGQTAWTRAVVS